MEKSFHQPILYRLLIDKSFIDNIPYNVTEISLVKAIIQLGHSLNAKVIAEGVETSEQMNFLKDSGCNLVQGYYIGKPVPVHEIEKLPHLNSLKHSRAI
jgi:EAL domain-containing protein (putative c-di-GMP-specific phosphodiesterase class I)